MCSRKKFSESFWVQRIKMVSDKSWREFSKSFKTIVFSKYTNTSFIKNGRNVLCTKMKFSIKDFFSKCDEVLNRKLHFLCSVM